MTSKQNAQKSLTPAGKLAAVVLFFLLVGAVGMLARPLLYNRVTNVEDYVPAVASVPTNTPRPTITPAPPTAVSTPEGWIARTDRVDGKKYLAPPLAVEAQIREAFDAVLSCAVITDGPDEEILAYDRQAVLERAKQVAVPEALDADFGEPCAELEEGQEGAYNFAEVFICDELGPENPVRCADRDTCTLGRAKKKALGVLIFDLTEDVPCPGALMEDALGNMCLARGDFDSTPNMIFTATIEKENGVWLVKEWHSDVIPEG